MTNLMFDWSAVGNMAIGALLLYAGKLAWQKYGSKDARVTPDGCIIKQEECRKKMLAEFYAYKLSINTAQMKQNRRIDTGDSYFKTINHRLDRMNLLLQSIITIQMTLCRKTPGVDCEDLTALLIKQGIEPETFGNEG